MELWRTIRDMNVKGMSNRETRKVLGISRDTISLLLRPYRLANHRQRKRALKLDPNRKKISVFIDENNLSAFRILEEIKKIAYYIGYTILKEYYHDLRKDLGYMQYT